MSHQSVRREADLIILGGGCAGLSLATNLAEAGTRLNVIVVEPRVAYHEDRTWCGWRLVPHAFEDCAVASWNHWRIATPAGIVERGSTRYPYEMIRSNLFYEKASRTIDLHPSLFLLKGLAAGAVTETEGRVEVALSDGSTLSAPWAIDTRPAQRTITPPWLWQNFVGFVVRLNASAGRQFSQVPMLMDFQPPGACIVQFMYVLPLGEREFLCEWTQFATVPGSFEEIASSLRAWLDAQAGSGWTLERREQGSLPMALPAFKPAGRVLPAGTQGGSMRASTGYAFHAIQRWAARCTASLQATGIPVAPPRHRLIESMDAIFLEVLQDRPALAMDIFRQLFENSPPDSLIRFLAGVPRSGDLWPIMLGLPWARFLRAAPRAIRSQVQARIHSQAQLETDPPMQSRSRT